MVNVSGHRLSTAEIEAALIEHPAVAEAAVVGVADELTGQAVNAFVAIKDGNEINDALRKDLILQVRKSIGPFAAPKAIHVVPDLPKTRSGKIMRRVLRKILAGEEDQLGDTSTVSKLWMRVLNKRSIADMRLHSCPTLPLSTKSLRLYTRARRSKRVHPDAIMRGCSVRILKKGVYSSVARTDRMTTHAEGIFLVISIPSR